MYLLFLQSDEKHNSHQQKTTKKKKKNNRKISHKDINVSSKTDKEVQTGKLFIYLFMLISCFIICYLF